jgi:hypothetical protein
MSSLSSEEGGLNGLIIAFNNGGAAINDINNQTLQLLAPQVVNETIPGSPTVAVRLCWCEVPVTRFDFLQLRPPCSLTPTGMTTLSQNDGGLPATPAGGGLCDAVRAIYDPNALNRIFADWDTPTTKGTPLFLRVRLLGDLIRDRTNTQAIDADNLPPWNPTEANPSGDGVAGGTFESWFTLIEQ